MLTEREKEVAAGFRQWARALASDDIEAMRSFERAWYFDDLTYSWTTKEQRNIIIRRLARDGRSPKWIAWKMQINIDLVRQVVRARKYRGRLAYIG